MKKSIFSALCLVLLATTTQSAWGAEGTATFGPDWNSLFGTSYTGSISGVTANSLTLTGTIDGVTITIENGKSTNGYVKSGDLRAYNNYTITFSSSNAITGITTIKGGKTFTTGITANVGKGSISNNAYTWTGNANTIVLSIGGTVSFSSITVTYSEQTTLYLGLFLAAFVAVRACVRRVECLYATFHHIIMSKIDFGSVHFAKKCFVCFFFLVLCCSFLLLDQKKRTKEKSRLWRLRCQKFVVSVSAKSNSLRSDSDLAFRHAQLDF